MVAANEIVQDNGVCPSTKALKERTLLPGLKKRNPPMRTAPLALDDCATRRVNAMIDQMRAGGRFNGLIALVRTGAVINHGLDGSLAGVMEGFYLHAQGIASLSWVGNH